MARIEVRIQLQRALDIIDGILEPLNEEINELRDEVLFNKIKSERSWERNVRRYDELQLRKYQTELIKNELLKVCYDEELFEET